MSLIDPIQLMNMMGTSPERKVRTLPKQNADNAFSTHMSTALARNAAMNQDGMIPSVDGSVMQDALMQDAINGLSGLLATRGYGGRSARNSASATGGIGTLSAKFESGDQGVEAIGYDSNGGTSYGTYQIASKPGTMKAFIQYLQSEAPEWAAQLKAAGPTNTGSTKGKMPAAWKNIAAQDADKFGQLQRDFIELSHYQPAKDSILARTGVNMDTMPAAAQEALWSTAVQHGPAGAAGIFSRIIKSIGSKVQSEKFAEKLIAKVYDERKQQFGSSTAAVQGSVKGRMDQEKQMVLAMLNTSGQVTA